MSRVNAYEKNMAAFSYYITAAYCTAAAKRTSSVTLNCIVSHTRPVDTPTCPESPRVS